MNPSVQNTIFSLGFLLYRCHLLRLRISAFLTIISVRQILSSLYECNQSHDRLHGCQVACDQLCDWLHVAHNFCQTEIITQTFSDCGKRWPWSSKRCLSTYSYYFLRRHVRACNQGCMQPVTWLVARVMWLVAGVTWQVAEVTRQVARVTWQVARVTWQVAEVACNQSCDWLQGLHATCHVTGCTCQITSVRHKLSLNPFLDECRRCSLSSKSC